jgi:hypothetical protein
MQRKLPASISVYLRICVNLTASDDQDGLNLEENMFGQALFLLAEEMLSLCSNVDRGD